jgi:hypothetical protein
MGCCGDDCLSIGEAGSRFFQVPSSSGVVSDAEPVAFVDDPPGFPVADQPGDPAAQVVRDAERGPVTGDGAAGEPVDVAAGYPGWSGGTAFSSRAVSYSTITWPVPSYIP